MALISFGYRVDMQAIASPSEGFIVAYDLDGILKQKDHTGLVSRIGGSSSTIINGGDAFTFSSDLVVSLANGKSFGKYETGATIPALGKTTSEVIIDSLSEPLNPILTLDSNTVIKYNQTEISNELTFSNDIKSLGATVSSVLLEFRKNNIGTWIPLFSCPPSTDTNRTNLTHLDYDYTGFNTDPYNYRYTVIDTKGASSSITKNITPMSYITPTINLTVTAVVKNSPETNLKREKGNITSYLSGTISRNTELVGLSKYQLQYQKSGTSDWFLITEVLISGLTASINSAFHYDARLLSADYVLYRVLVTDEHQITESTPIKVEFFNMIFFGPSASVPTTSTGIRSLPDRIFTDSFNPSILNTGNVYSTFIFSLPATFKISTVYDLDSTNASMPYSSKLLDVMDFDQILVSYKIYSTTQAVPYTSNHKHQITRVIV